LSIDWDILSTVMQPAAVTVAKSRTHHAFPEPALPMQSQSIWERAFALSAPSPLSWRWMRRPRSSPNSSPCPTTLVGSGSVCLRPVHRSSAPLSPPSRAEVAWPSWLIARTRRACRHRR